MFPAGFYLFKVNNRNTRTRCEICSKLTIKIPERRRRCSGIFIINFEHISHLVLVFLLLTWKCNCRLGSLHPTLFTSKTASGALHHSLFLGMRILQICFPNLHLCCNYWFSFVLSVDFCFTLPQNNLCRIKK